jgi:hypothetical protein
MMRLPTRGLSICSLQAGYFAVLMIRSSELAATWRRTCEIINRLRYRQQASSQAQSRNCPLAAAEPSVLKPCRQLLKHHRLDLDVPIETLTM